MSWSRLDERQANLTFIHSLCRHTQVVPEPARVAHLGERMRPSPVNHGHVALCARLLPRRRALVFPRGGLHEMLVVVGSTHGEAEFVATFAATSPSKIG